MMIRTSIARRTTNVTSGQAALEILAGTKGCFLRELHIILAAATASTYGFGRPAAKGITPTTPVTNLLEGPGFGVKVAEVKTALAWGTGPTIPSEFYRRVGFPATIASFVLWEFPGQGLFIPANGSMVIWNLALNGVVDANLVTEELL